MKYKHLSIFSIFTANLLFAVAFCLGMYAPLACIAGAFLLMGAGFWLVQGKVHMGYQYATVLLATAAAQWYFNVPDLYSLTTASVAIIFIILQTIDRVFKNKPLLPI